MTETLLSLCCVCESIKTNDMPTWIQKGCEPLYTGLRSMYGNNLTHGYCDTCKDNTKRELGLTK